MSIQQLDPPKAVSSETLDTETHYVTQSSADITTAEDVRSCVSKTIACEWEDTTTPGEYIMEHEDKKFLIAITNASRLRTNPDLDDFRKRTFVKAKAGEIDGGLFLSLNSKLPNIPTACDFSCMQIRSKAIPLLIIATNSLSGIQIALRCLLKFETEQPREKSELEKQINVLQQTLPKILGQKYSWETRIESRIELLTTLLNDALQEREEQQAYMFTVHKLRQQMPWLAEELQDDEAVLEQAIKIIRQFEKNQETPKTSRMTQAQRQVIKDAGGMKLVTDAARRRASETCSNDTDKTPSCEM